MSSLSPGTIVVVSLSHAPPVLPDLGNFKRIRKSIEAVDSERVWLVSPLGDVDLSDDDPGGSVQAIARMLAEAWLPQLNAETCTEEDFLRGRTRLEAYCTPTEIIFLRRVTWPLVASLVRECWELVQRRASATLTGDHGEGDVLDGYIPRDRGLLDAAKNMQAKAARMIDVAWRPIEDDLLRDDREEAAMRWLMEEPPLGRDAHPKTWADRKAVTTSRRPDKRKPPAHHPAEDRDA